MDRIATLEVERLFPVDEGAIIIALKRSMSIVSSSPRTASTSAGFCSMMPAVALPHHAFSAIFFSAS